METNEIGELTFKQLMDRSGYNESSVRQALLALGISGRNNQSDRRYKLYPADSARRVKDWLDQRTNNQQ